MVGCGRVGEAAQGCVGLNRDDATLHHLAHGRARDSAELDSFMQTLVA
jgi:hypothetical protein